MPRCRLVHIGDGDCSQSSYSDDDDFEYGLATNEQQKTLCAALEKLRIAGAHTDITLQVGGKKFPAHKCVLIAGSGYFKDMLEANMLEKSEESVELDDMEAGAFNRVLEYLYTGELVITKSKAVPMLSIVNKLQLNSKKVTQRFSKYLAGKIDEENILQLLKLCSTYEMDELKEKCVGFIAANLDDLEMGESSCLNELDVKQMRALLDCDGLSAKETRLAEIVKKWYLHDEENRKCEVGELINCLRYGLLRKEDLEEDLMDVEEWRKACVVAAKHHDSGIKKAWVQTKMNQVRADPGPVLFAYFDDQFCKGDKFKVEGIPWGNDFLKCDMLVVEEDERSRLEPINSHWIFPKEDNPVLSHAGYTTFNNFLFVCGGLNRHGKLSSRSFMFDPRFLTWEELNAPIIGPRKDFALVEFKGCLYAIGGQISEDSFHDNQLEKYTTSIVRYDPLDNTWSHYDKLPEVLVAPGAVSFKDKIFVFGGTSQETKGGKKTHKLFKYNVARKYFNHLSSQSKKEYMRSPVLIAKDDPVTGQIGLMVIDVLGAHTYNFHQKYCYRIGPLSSSFHLAPKTPSMVKMPPGGIGFAHKDRLFLANCTGSYKSIGLCDEWSEDDEDFPNAHVGQEYYYKDDFSGLGYQSERKGVDPRRYVQVPKCFMATKPCYAGVLAVPGHLKVRQKKND